MILDVESISVSYGKTQIINDLSIKCSDDEIISILGRNGMGKTTLLKCIMGLLPTDNGQIHFKNEDVTSLEPHERARMGMTLVPQGRDIFPELTVKENLRMGQFDTGDGQIDFEEVFSYFPILEERLEQKGGTLSGGQQQMLAIARGLMTNPNLILLDEPSEGVQPSIVKDIAGILPQIHQEQGIPIIIVEQNIDLAFSVASRGYIIENGTIVAQGSTEEFRDSTIIQEKIGV